MTAYRLSQLPPDAMRLSAEEKDVTRSVGRWIIAAYACIALALGSVLGISVWGVVHDMHEIRMTRLNAELNRIRSHATRTVSMLQDALNQSPDKAPYDVLRNNEWLREFWKDRVINEQSRIYGTVLDPTGLIIAHSNPTVEGQRIDLANYGHEADEVGNVGEDIVETTDPLLSAGEKAYDIQSPIFFHDKPVATYHVGFNCAWFDAIAAEAQHRAKLRWAAILSFMLAVVAASFVSLYHITRRATLLGESMRLARIRRFAELGQLIGGIAHEIRNPLNAMLLNLHTLERFERKLASTQGNASENSDMDSLAIIRETNREVERVEELMKILLGYARPERPNNDVICVADEVTSILRFLRREMEGSDIQVVARLPQERICVYIDRNRLRQIVLNLLTNAREAIESGGRIEISIERRDGAVAVEVCDSGPGVPRAERQRIFEAFYSTKPLGTGLGLPLVKRFADEAGGTIEYVDRPEGGACFLLTLNEVESSKEEKPCEPSSSEQLPVPATVDHLNK